MEQFTVNVDNTDFKIIPLEEEDQVLYEVHNDKLICAIGRNEDGQWEATSQVDENLVRKIGAAIEKQESNT